MQMALRRISSGRLSKAKPIEIEPNWCGQGGSQDLIFKTEEGWLIIKPESEAEVRQLMSVIACMFKNYKEPCS